MKRHIFLIGYRGSGKTSVGKLLARNLDRAFVDSDDLVEANAKSTIRQIFESTGEDHFRQLETQAIRQIIDFSNPHLVSLGGGAVLRVENQSLIRSAGWIIWLRASAADLVDRIYGDAATADRRPPLTKLSPMEEVQTVLSAREPIYESLSDFSIVTDKLPVEDVAERIKEFFFANEKSPSAQT